ncbi:hypothetical protein YC2023_049310 [Brassica napus]
MVVVFGGLVHKKFLNDIIVYDIKNKLWFEPECTGSVSEGKVGPTPRAFHVAITIDCHMFIFGGRSGGKRLGDFWVLDTDIWQWSELTSFGDLPTPRDFSAAAAIGSQKIVVLLASSLCELTNLEELRLTGDNQSDGAYDVDFVCNFVRLRHLDLNIHMTRLPDHSRFPPHLAHITLRHCQMEEDPLQILEKLLHLKSVELSFSAFVGRKMVCSKGGFPQLCKLDIMFLYDLEEWIVEEGSMPCLRTLSIRFCDKLKELPEGLKYITSLKELKITDKNKEWKTTLVPGGESYHKVQHIPSVQLDYRGEE